MEDGKEKQDAILQSEFETDIFNANIYKEKYEQTELILQETRREKDELISNLQHVADRVPLLEERIRELETLNTETTSALQKLKDTIISHVRYGGQHHIHDEDEDELARSTPANTLDHKSTTRQSSEGTPSKSRGKPECRSPIKSSAKTSVIGDIDIDEIEVFFKNIYSKNEAMEEDMKNLKDELQKKRQRNEDLETTLQGTQDSIVRLNNKVTDSIQEEYVQKNVTITDVESNVENTHNKAKEERPKHETKATNDKSVATTNVPQSEIRHTAPAGKTYLSIQDAGRSTLETYCDNYPNTTSSFILPNLFLTSFPDVIDNPQVSLTEKQKRQFDGFVSNLAGERSEYDIYLAFTSLARKCPVNPILVIWGCKFDSDNSRAIKRNVLKQELPSIQLGPGEMSQEKDFIIFVRGVGVVFAEVKKSATEVNIEKAEQQLNEAEYLFKKVMYAISGPSGPLLPTSKLILIPGESGASPADKISSGCHLIYNDIMQNFQAKWSDVVGELEKANAKNPINPSDFERLIQIVTGIWSMKPVQKKFFQFNNDQGSFVSNIQRVDKSISDAVLCSEKGAHFSANVSSSLITEVSHCDDELNVLYFSPQQKLIFDNYKQALIRAHAGCGKTLLLLIKILDTLDKDPTQMILLVAPKPHHLRSKKILERNNVTVEIIRSFPSSPITSPASCQVVIVKLQVFFQVPRNTLLSYNLSLFNLFFDDLHGYDVPYGGDYSDFTGVGDFVDYAYSVSKVNDKICWFGIDIAQQRYFENVEGNKVTGIFLTKSGSERDFNIPVVVMDQILRNSTEIVKVLESARTQQANDFELDTSKMISNLQCGHHITSQKVVYHKLKLSDWNDELQTKFVCARVEELLSALSSNSSSSSSSSFDFSTVAILFDGEYPLSNYKSALEPMLLNTFNLGVQTIRQQIINNNNTCIVMDYVVNAQSFESAVLVYVRSSGRGIVYNVLSRGRTVCMIIDVNDRSPFPLQNIDIVQWKESNGEFTQIN